MQKKWADQAKQQFAHPDGDHLTMLNAYHAYKSDASQPDPMKWCRENYLNYRSLQSCDSVRTQLQRIMERNGMDLVSTPWEDKSYYVNIRRALCSGFFMQVAKKTNGKNYITVKDNQTVLLHPSTVLAQESEWLIYNEFVLTSKNYIRTVTTVKPEWLLELAPLYYDLSTFSKGDVKSALERIQELQRKREARSSKSSKGKRRD